VTYRLVARVAIAASLFAVAASVAWHGWNPLRNGYFRDYKDSPDGVYLTMAAVGFSVAALLAAVGLLVIWPRADDTALLPWLSSQGRRACFRPLCSSGAVGGRRGRGYTLRTTASLPGCVSTGLPLAGSASINPLTTGSHLRIGSA
jgi:hypothetical protein